MKCKSLLKEKNISIERIFSKFVFQIMSVYKNVINDEEQYSFVVNTDLDDWHREYRENVQSLESPVKEDSLLYKAMSKVATMDMEGTIELPKLPASLQALLIFQEARVEYISKWANGLSKIWLNKS